MNIVFLIVITASGIARGRVRPARIFSDDAQEKWRLTPGSDAVLHMSRIEFNELSSCEVRRLDQLETADIIRIGLTVLHAWLSRK